MDYFDFTGVEKVVDGVCLRQIVALRSLPRHGVAKGDIGGFITSHDSITSGAWVTPNAIVTNRASAHNGALVTGEATLSDDVYISGNVTIDDNATVSDSARLIDSGATPYSSIVVSGNATVTDNARVMTMTGDSRVLITDDTHVSNNATIVGTNVVIADNAIVTDEATVQGAVCVDGDSLLIRNSIASGTNPDKPTHITLCAILWEWVYVTNGRFGGETLLPGM